MRSENPALAARMPAHVDDVLAEVDTPALVIDLDLFEGNLAAMADDFLYEGRIDGREAERIGINHLIFESPVQRDDERFDMIEAFAQDVLPAFRPRAV